MNEDAKALSLDPEISTRCITCEQKVEEPFIKLFFVVPDSATKTLLPLCHACDTELSVTTLVTMRLSLPKVIEQALAKTEGNLT